MTFENGDKQKLRDLDRRVGILEAAKTEVLAERVAALDWRVNDMDDRMDKRLDSLVATVGKMEAKQDSQSSTITRAAVAFAGSSLLIAASTVLLIDKLG